MIEEEEFVSVVDAEEFITKMSLWAMGGGLVGIGVLIAFAVIYSWLQP